MATSPNSHDRLRGPLTPDPVIEAYKKDVDRSLLRENLKLTVEQRLTKFIEFVNLLSGLRNSATRPPSDR